MSSVILPIFKAKKKNKDEEVKGSLIDDKLNGEVRILIEFTSVITQIDPDTIGVSFDNGIHWRSIEQVEEKWR